MNMEHMEGSVFEQIQDRLLVRPLNLRRCWENGREAVVIRQVGEIALVLYLQIADTGGVLTSMRIPHFLIEKWGVKKEEVFQAAMENTLRMYPPRIYHWEEGFSFLKYKGEAFMEEDTEPRLWKNGWANCISSTNKLNGAAVIFLPGVADRLSQLMESDLYLAFTSIHEVMVHSAKYTDPEQLKGPLQDTMRDWTADSEYLSGEIYRYRRAAGVIEVV